MIGGAFGVRARMCARCRSGGSMIAPRGGGDGTSHRLLDKVGRFTDETCISFPKTILTIVQACAIIDADGTCENIVPMKERPQKRYAEDDQKGLVSSKTPRSQIRVAP